MTESNCYAAEQKLVAIGELAHKLGISVATLRRWEREGRITAQRTLGGHRRYVAEDVQAAMQPTRSSPI